MIKYKHFTGFYVYKIEFSTGYFYFGSHACTGKSYSCTDKKCNYKGTGKQLIKHRQDNPNALEVKSVIYWGLSVKEIREKEESYIGLHIYNPMCLNKNKSTSKKLPEHSKDGLKAIKEGSKRKRTKMIDPGGATHWVNREDISMMIYKRWVFSNKVVWIKHVRLGLYGQFSAKTVCRLWRKINNKGWRFGYDRSFKRINAKELYENIGVKKIETVQKTVMYEDN